MSTLPSDISVAVWEALATAIPGPVAQASVAGSYSSVDAVDRDLSEPPTTSTRPSRSSVAVWSMRATLSGAAIVQDCEPGS